MSCNITRQLVHAVHDCYTPGHSKRADKFNPAIDTSWKIYSSASRRDMLDMAKDFGAFLREQCPDLTRAAQITPDNIQAYINAKAATCVDATLGKIMSRVGKLEVCCRHAYSGDRDAFEWRVKGVATPSSTKNADFVKDTPVPLEVSKTILSALREKRASEVGNAVTLSVYAGMRANETTCLKAKNIFLSGGEFGFGYVTITKGPEGGAKGGRPRTIPILNQEAQDALKGVIAGKQPENYVAAKADGTKMTPDNVQRSMREVMDKQFGHTYKGNRNHGMRKAWAQRYYDVVRTGGCTRREAVSKTNEVLGHGANRGEVMVKMYVANIW